MKKVTGYIDEFRRANILERMPKTYFFDEDEKPDKIKYIRKRDEPTPAEEVKQYEVWVSEIPNQLLDQTTNFHEPRRNAYYEDLLKRGQKQHYLSNKFSYNVVEKVATVSNTGYTFQGGKKFQAPPRLYNVNRSSGKEKEKPIIRKALEDKSQQYDFFVLARYFHQRYEQSKMEEGGVSPTANNNVSFLEKYDSATMARDLKSISYMKELPERMKTFTYDPLGETMEQYLYPIYQMKLVDRSIIQSNEALLRTYFKIPFERELGQTNRHPVENLYHLFSNELVIQPDDFRFCDIINVASWRLNNKSIRNCVRTGTVSKQYFLNAQKIYDRLMKEQTLTMDQEVEVGEQMVQDEFAEGLEEAVVEEQETPRIVQYLSTLKYEYGKMRPTVPNEDHLVRQVYKRLHFLLNLLYEKIVKELPVSNPTLYFLRKNNHLVQGHTAHGYERKRLLWLYADCAQIFGGTAQGYNISNLIVKSSTQKTVVTTVYVEKTKKKTSITGRNVGGKTTEQIRRQK